MKALITGASSGIGRDMAKILSGMGYDLILVARREERLLELAKQLPGKVRILPYDLSKAQNCIALYRKVRDEKISVLINNAGFGLFGAFDKTDLRTELDMIDTNIRALHILTKLFLRDFVRQDKGYILNVASSAAFLPGPLMACYYSTKAYVLRLSLSIREELRRQGSRVSVSVLCPGPVDTEFNERADVQFSLHGLESSSVAKYAIRGMFQRKAVLVPGALMKASRIASKLSPDWLLARISYHIQHRKNG